MRITFEALASDRRIGRFMLIGIIVLSVFFYLIKLNGYPLTDYDEATYAQVTRDTLASGDILTLKRFDQNWFEKPPLYFWMAMGATSIFGTEDYVYRLPSVLLAIIGIALLWLLVRTLTNNNLTALLASLILLFMPFYFLSAREVRLDIPVITTMLASLVALVYGWQNQRWLLLLFPAIGIGIMLKSVIALLALLLILAFSIAYRKFSWIRSKYLWIGLLISLVLVVPWHWYEGMKGGSMFWQTYLGYTVFQRYGAGIAGAGTVQPFALLQKMYIYGEPWFMAFLGSCAYALWSFIKKEKNSRDPLLIASCVCAVVITIFFSFSRTRILTYLLPVFPLMAIVIAVVFSELVQKTKSLRMLSVKAAVFTSLVIFSLSISLRNMSMTISSMRSSFDYDEKAAGLIVAKEKKPGANLYLLSWPKHETLRYYSGRQITNLPYPPELGTVLKAPWYLFVPNLTIPFFLDEKGQVKEQYHDVNVLYKTDYIFLFSGDSDLKLE